MIDKMDLRATKELNEYMNLGRIFFCSNCTRSFGSKEFVGACKFCGSDVFELNGHKKKEQLFRFFCPACDKSSISEKLESCPKCGCNALHPYPIDKIGKKEFLTMRKRQILGNIRKIFSKGK